MSFDIARHSFHEYRGKKPPGNWFHRLLRRWRWRPNGSDATGAETSARILSIALVRPLLWLAAASVVVNADVFPLSRGFGAFSALLPVIGLFIAFRMLFVLPNSLQQATYGQKPARQRRLQPNFKSLFTFCLGLIIFLATTLFPLFFWFLAIHADKFDQIGSGTAPRATALAFFALESVALGLSIELRKILDVEPYLVLTTREAPLWFKISVWGFRYSATAVFGVIFFVLTWNIRLFANRLWRKLIASGTRPGVGKIVQHRLKAKPPRLPRPTPSTRTSQSAPLPGTDLTESRTESYERAFEMSGLTWLPVLASLFCFLCLVASLALRWRLNGYLSASMAAISFFALLFLSASGTATLHGAQLYWHRIRYGRLRLALKMLWLLAIAAMFAVTISQSIFLASPEPTMFELTAWVAFGIGVAGLMCCLLVGLFLPLTLALYSRLLDTSVVSLTSLSWVAVRRELTALCLLAVVAALVYAVLGPRFVGGLALFTAVWSVLNRLLTIPLLREVGLRVDLRLFITHYALSELNMILAAVSVVLLTNFGEGW